MRILDQLSAYRPQSPQEQAVLSEMLAVLGRDGQWALARENQAHFTASAFVVTPALDRVLLVYHLLRDCWAWPGGHADGNDDLLAVAMAETRQETGLTHLTPLCPQPVSLDLFAVEAHRKGDVPVPAHRHLSVGYILVGNRDEALRPCPGETAQARWVPPDFFTPQTFSPVDLALYRGLWAKARAWAGQ